MSHALVEKELYLPEGMGFIDATDILEKGTAAMDFGTILSMDGFTVQDAMSALEIMDPRMDSGTMDSPPPFDPYIPLLPSEVCWILDRSFACETSWHNGLSLSQTIFTLQYVHHLADISFPGFDVGPVNRLRLMSRPAESPMELVTLVLRASVFGLLKCCDLVWRELANSDHLIDGEDWNGEKYSVSLCEGVQSDAVMRLLDEALHWLQESPSLTFSSWRAPLVHRILLRKNILQTLAFPSFPALNAAKRNLRDILDGPEPPQPSVTVQNVFDKAISRRLISYIPTRVVEIPPQMEAWTTISIWLDGWQDVRGFMEMESLRNFKMYAMLRAYDGKSSVRSAFLRSLSISTFFNGQKILLVHDPPWLIDRFFWETAAIRAGIFSELEVLPSKDINPSRPTSSGQGSEARNSQSLHTFMRDNGESGIELFEKGVAKLLVDFFSSFFHNRARQRRNLAASLLDWHLALDEALKIAGKLSTSSSLKKEFSRVPLCIRHTRISIVCDTIFSGFELELYKSDEWAMMFWYAGQLLTTQIAILEELKDSISENRVINAREAKMYISFQLEYAEALRFFSVAMRDVLCLFAPVKSDVNGSQEQANFKRRFKWAFISGYSEATIPDEDRPILEKWREMRESCKLDRNTLSDAVSNLSGAKERFTRLVDCTPDHSGAVLCPEAYKELMGGLLKACDANLTFLDSSPETREKADWNWQWKSSRWFPEAENL